MLVFKNIEEMKPYYNAETNTYEFKENDRMLDISIEFDLDCLANIEARDIKAKNITALYIKSDNLDAYDIIAENVEVRELVSASEIKVKLKLSARIIESETIEAGKISAVYVTATHSINACNIVATSIVTLYLNANCINTHEISAKEISYSNYLINSESIVCMSIKERKEDLHIYGDFRMGFYIKKPHTGKERTK